MEGVWVWVWGRNVRDYIGGHHSLEKVYSRCDLDGRHLLKNFVVLVGRYM